MLGGSKSFDKRVKVIERTHRRAPKGRVQVVGPDGVVFSKKRRAMPSISFKGILYLLLGLALFKAIAMAQFGAASYNERVEALRQGTVIEQAGAWIMQPDRFSAIIAAQIAPFIR